MDFSLAEKSVSGFLINVGFHSMESKSIHFIKHYVVQFLVLRPYQIVWKNNNRNRWILVREWIAVRILFMGGYGWWSMWIYRRLSIDDGNLKKSFKEGFLNHQKTRSFCFSTKKIFPYDQCRSFIQVSLNKVVSKKKNVGNNEMNGSNW